MSSAGREPAIRGGGGDGGPDPGAARHDGDQQAPLHPHLPTSGWPPDSEQLHEGWK